jgi:hypothetical protein
MVNCSDVHGGDTDEDRFAVAPREGVAQPPLASTHTESVMPRIALTSIGYHFSRCIGLLMP